MLYELNVRQLLGDNLMLTSLDLDACGFPGNAGGSYTAGLSDETNIAALLHISIAFPYRSEPCCIVLFFEHLFT